MCTPFRILTSGASDASRCTQLPTRPLRQGPTGLLRCVTNTKVPSFPSTGFLSLSNVPSRKTKCHLHFFLFFYPTSSASASPVLCPVSKIQWLHRPHCFHCYCLHSGSYSVILYTDLCSSLPARVFASTLSILSAVSTPAARRGILQKNRKSDPVAHCLPHLCLEQLLAPHRGWHQPRLPACVTSSEPAPPSSRALPDAL